METGHHQYDFMVRLAGVHQKHHEQLCDFLKDITILLQETQDPCTRAALLKLVEEAGKDTVYTAGRVCHLLEKTNLRPQLVK